jgi:hypothetical protein
MIGTASQGKASATADVLSAMLAQCPDSLSGKRDRALLALGFAGAFRRSELVALQVEDLTEVPDGLRVVIRHSKTDQESLGQEIAIPRGYRLRPVEALQTWLAAAEIRVGGGTPWLSASRGPWPNARALCAPATCKSCHQHEVRRDEVTHTGWALFPAMRLHTRRGGNVPDLFKEHAGAAFL